jgi:hypothetical protein
VQASGTPFSVLIIGDRITSYVASSSPYELWRVDGLGPLQESATSILPGKRSLRFMAPGGDMRSQWELGFSHGLEIRYREEFDGP